MSHPERRIFVYKSTKPEPSEPPDRAPRQHPPEETDILRAWILTPIGAVVIWVLSLGLIIPAIALVLSTFPEAYAQFALGGGLWVLLGVVIIHWWLPPGDPDSRHAEGIAIAGWHVFTTLLVTAVFAWMMLFTNGRPAFTLSEVYPVIFIGGMLLVMFGAIFTLLRGHLPGRGLRHAWTMLCLLAMWAGLWPVAAQTMM